MSQYELYERRLVQALSGNANAACPSNIRHRLLERTRKMARDYQNGNPEAPWEEVEQFLGDPRELAQVMLEGEDQEVLKRYTHRKRLRQRIVLGVMAVLLAVSFCLLAYAQSGWRQVITVEETLTVSAPVDSAN